MLTIRTSQLHTLGEFAQGQFIDELVDQVHRFFPDAGGALAPDILRRKLGKCIERAATYHLFSRQHVSRFINLAAVYGWEYDSDPALRWMHSILTDTRLVSPGERLERLMQTCVHREHIEHHNRALREHFGGAPRASTVHREERMIGQSMEVQASADDVDPAWVDDIEPLLRDHGN